MKRQITLIDPADLPLVLDEPYSVLEDVVIDGEGTPPDCQFGIYIHADHCTVRNVHVSNMPRIGIGVRGVTQTLVERAHVEHTAMQGIWVERDCDGARIADCHVLNSGKDNIQVAGLNGSVLNSQVEGAGNGQPNFAGIYVAANSRQMLVAGNLCTGNGTGIDYSWGFEDGDIRNGGPISCGNVIHSNRSYSNNSCGIACGSNGAIISHNQCLDNGLVPVVIPSSGIGLVNASGCVVTDNMLANTSDAQPQKVGLFFLVNGASGNASRNCMVIGNHFARNADFPIRQWFARRYSALDSTHGHVIADNFGA